MKKILSGLMAGIMLATSCLHPVPASAESISLQQEKPTISSDLSVEGTNSFGTMLAEAMTEGYEELTENEGYSVFAIEMEGKIAHVSLQAEKSCTLAVALFDNSGAEMLTMASSILEADQRTADVEFEIEEMPQYFYLRAFIVDTDTLRPLCEKYECPLYTQKWQEFFSKTTEDFEPERVFNLDDDNTTNFGVFSDDVTVYSQDSETNKLVAYNNTEYIYTVENADESITSLAAGETVVFPIENNDIIVVTVGSLIIEGSTVTINGVKPELEGVFSYLRVEGQDDLEDAEVDTSEVPEFVQYQGIVKNTVESQSGNIDEMYSDRADEYESDGDPFVYESVLSYKFDPLIECKHEGENLKCNAKINGEINITFKLSCDLYLNWDDSFFELKLDYTKKGSFGINGSIEGDINLGELPFAPIPGVKIALKFYFCVTLSGNINFSFLYSGTVGFRIEDGTTKDLSTKPKVETEFKISAKFFFGLKLKLSASLLELNDDIKLGEIAATARIGLEVNGSLSYKPKEGSAERHACDNCIQGTWGIVLAVGVEATIANIEGLTVSGELRIPAFPTYDFYYSFDHCDGSISSKCPHKEYRITAIVETHETGKKTPVYNAAITNGPGELLETTHRDGKAYFYLEPDSHFLRATLNGYTTDYEWFAVKQAATIYFDIEPCTGTYNGYSYSVDEKNHATILKYVGQQTLIKIPETIGGAPVTAIGYKAFENCSVEGVQLNNGLEIIGNLAFNNCKRLHSITFPKSIKTVANNAFSGCIDLKTATFQEGLTKIPNNALKNCTALNTVTIPTTVTSIGSSAFYGTALESISIHHGVTTIEGHAFSNCTSLKSVSIPATLTSSGNTNNPIFSGCTALANISFATGLKKIPSYLFKNCTGFTSISIPSSVTEIGIQAFCGSGLKELNLPEGLVAIKDNAFSNCTSLKSVSIPATLTSSGDSFDPVFSGCTSLTDVTLADGLKIIPSYLFKECTCITAIAIPSSVTEIGIQAFCGSGLKELNLPGTVTTIGNGAFSSTPIETLDLPEGLVTIKDNAFSNCTSLKSVSIPTTLTSSGYSYNPIFSGCTALTDVTLADGLKRIPSYLFKECTCITAIAIPSSVTEIGLQAFCGSGLKELNLPGTVTTIGSGAFSSTPIETLDLPEGLVTIEGHAFSDCTSLKSVSIPTTLKNSGNSFNPIFSGCTALTDVTLADGLKIIPSYLLEDCTGITVISIPFSVTEIGNRAFSGTKITTVLLPSGLTKINAGAFSKTNISSISIPSGVLSIGFEAFSDCSALSSATINGAKTTVGSDTFKNCSSDLVIYCYADSPAEKYAKNNNIAYSIIGAAVGDSSEQAQSGNDDSVDEEITTSETDPDSDVTEAVVIINPPKPDRAEPSMEEPIVYENYWSFENLTPGETYNFYAVVSKEAEDFLASDNILYIEQFAADENGCARVGYTLSSDIVPEVLAVQMSPYSISGAEVSVNDMVFTGGLLVPGIEVIYEGSKLRMGIDYEISGEYLVTEVGTYSLTVKGINDYFGTVAVSYSVLPEEQKKVIAIEVLTEPLKNEYYIGQQFTAFGGKLKLYYDNEYEEEVELSADMVSDFTSETAGEQTVNIAVGDAAAKYIVNIIEIDEAKPFVTVESENCKVTLSWQKVKDAEKYSVLKYDNGEFTVISDEITDITYTVDSLTNDVEYMFAVKAYANGNWTELSAADYISATPCLSLAPKPVAVPGNKEVKLTWEAIPGAERYSVSIVDDIEIATCVSDLTVTEYVVKELTNGTEYKFLVRAYVGDEWSKFSEKDYVTATPFAPVVAKPTNVKATPGDSKVTLSWDVVEDATKYKVQYRLSGETEWTEKETTATSYTVKGLTNGTRYDFVVLAGDESDWSEYADEDIVSATPVKPEKPTILGVKPGENKVKLEWKAVTGAEMYRVYTYENGTYTRRFTCDGSRTIATVSDLKANVKYGFVVSAKANGVWTDYSDKADLVYATPTAPVEPVVVKPAITAYKPGTYKVKLEWKAVEGAEMYRVYTYENGAYTRKFTCLGSRNVATVTSLVSGVKLGFVVSAKVNGTWTDYTDKADLVYATPVGDPAPVITGVKGGDGKVKISWHALSGAEMYRVYTCENGAYTRKFTCNGSTNVATVTGLTNGKEYAFVVSAKVNGVWTNYKVSELLVYATPNA